MWDLGNIDISAILWRDVFRTYYSVSALASKVMDIVKLRVKRCTLWISLGLLQNVKWLFVINKGLNSADPPLTLVLVRRTFAMIIELRGKFIGLQTGIVIIT